MQVEESTSVRKIEGYNNYRHCSFILDLICKVAQGECVSLYVWIPEV